MNVFLFGCDRLVKKDNTLLPKENVYITITDADGVDNAIIKLPDGKVILIDCGNQSDGSYKAIEKQLNACKIDVIDYLIITHPDSIQIGACIELLQNFTVKKVYYTDIGDNKIGTLCEFYQIKEYLIANDYYLESLDYHDYFFGEQYSVCFLTPMPMGLNGAYDMIYEAETFTDKMLNDLSPIIYIEIYGVRLVFCSHASQTQEKLVLDCVKANLYSHFYTGLNGVVNLRNVEFLHLADGGSKESGREDFLSYLNPKSAIATASRKAPSSVVLGKLEQINDNYKLYRSDTMGTINVNIKSDKTYYVQTYREE